MPCQGEQAENDPLETQEPSHRNKNSIIRNINPLHGSHIYKKLSIDSGANN